MAKRLTEDGKKKACLTLADTASNTSVLAARLRQEKNAEESSNSEQTPSLFHFSTWLVIFNSGLNWRQKSFWNKKHRFVVFVFFFPLSLKALSMDLEWVKCCQLSWLRHTQVANSSREM